ncbi:hypothetical protein DFJ58DRAFT_775804 [Suillus subalutaceus]|uniref:uncharacterized protein n=1 Tax=Suillus subalutaceus TaxID=48586 RepID=UPI001B872FC5|nr:uncharacterized protein DFJ58DRAFT_775804 [Suillus subalutaceus]KAG1862568.1 hypothetical protein DFJ58DRAFT_775804 [Suillus subalutaceus]
MASVDLETAIKQEEEYLRKVHPTVDDVPGCMTLFDEFLQCHSIYGQMSECGVKKEDFKFCMSLKFMHPEQKRDAWIRRRAEWWAHRRLGKSSENVWDMRKSPLPDWPPALSDNVPENVETIS